MSTCTTPFDRRTFLAACAATAGLPAAEALAAEPPRRLLLIAGTPSHGPGHHEFNAGVQLLAECLQSVPGLAVRVQLNGYPQDESLLHEADAIALFSDGGGGHPFIQEQRLATLGKLMDRGVGLMCLHFAVEVPADRGGAEFQRWIGGHYEHLYSCNPMWAPEIKELPDHAIARGVEPFSISDEWYFNMRFAEDEPQVMPILQAIPSDDVRDGPYVYPPGPYEHIQAAKGRTETLLWAVERADGGRGAGFTGGHFHANWGDDNFRKVVLNALCWVAQVDVPENGIESRVTDEQLAANLDPK